MRDENFFPAQAKCYSQVATVANDWGIFAAVPRRATFVRRGSSLGRVAVRFWAADLILRASSFLIVIRISDNCPL